MIDANNNNQTIGEYSIFGASQKEAPHLTWARNILGVGRAADLSEIKAKYRNLSKEWHPDKHNGTQTEDIAAEKFKIYARAYALFSRENTRLQAEQEFLEALESPFLVGDRVFCLGSLYGIRIYSPGYNGEAIIDTNRLLTGIQGREALMTEERARKFYGVRQSILENVDDDLMEMYYTGNMIGEYKKTMIIGFGNMNNGGIDDLPWIKNNDLAVYHFMERDFKKATGLFKEINEDMIRGNIILMYRYGISLEAKVAELKNRTDTQLKYLWKRSMEQAIELYDNCLMQIRRSEKPKEALLTILMQLASAYEEIGYKAEAKRAWEEVKDIDPKSREADESMRRLTRRISPKTEKPKKQLSHLIRGLLGRGS